MTSFTTSTALYTAVAAEMFAYPSLSTVPKAGAVVKRTIEEYQAKATYVDFIDYLALHNGISS